jgi:hypothetical protein
LRLHFISNQSRGFEDYRAATLPLKIWRPLLGPEVCSRQPSFNSRERIEYNQHIDRATRGRLSNGQSEVERKKSTHCLYRVLQPVILIRKEALI